MLATKGDKKSLLSNFSSLAILQLLNMFLPLITLPYLVQVLGVETFGLLSFSLSIVMIFNIFISFGFELSATREISMNKSSLDKISEIFCSVLIIKSIFLLLSFIILLIILVLSEYIAEHSELYIITFGVVLGNSLFPTWIFQGMERMKYITIINAAVKIFFTLLVFKLVLDESDYLYVPLLSALGAFIGGGGALLLAIRMFNIKINCPSIKNIIHQFNSSKHFFLSRMANEGSRHYTITLVGLYFGNTVLGYYSMVEKLFYACMSIIGVVSQTLYPYMSRVRNIKLFVWVLVVAILLTVTFLIPIYIFKSDILYLVFNVSNELLSNIFSVIFTGLLFGVISTLIGYPLLGAYGYTKQANDSLIISSVFCVVYMTIAASITGNILVVSISIPVYLFLCMCLRCYYVYKSYYVLKNGGVK